MKNLLSASKKWILLTLAVAVVCGAATSWTLAKSAKETIVPPNRLEIKTKSVPPDQGMKWSKAILSVSNMTCGGCINTIKKSVAPLPGTGDVYVDLASGTVEVFYDETLMADPQTIARAITRGGYPAEIKNTISSGQLRLESALAAKQTQTYIAKVGKRKIRRKDYTIELKHARIRYEKVYGSDMFSSSRGKQLLQRIETQIVQRLIDEAIKFQEIKRAGYTIQEDKVDRELSIYAQEQKMTMEQLKKELKVNGFSFDYFRKKFAQRLILQNYLEDKVLAGSIDEEDRRKRYTSWLTNNRTMAKITFYDKRLEALLKTTGGSCCGGAGCSASR